MRIQHNIMSLNAHRQLGNNNNNVSKSLEKLSSGFKINRAGDDAAGLAISEKMRAQITGLTRAQSNAQDGISLVQTAEGALTETHSMLNRLVDLATQSENGTFKAEDRQKIQDEVNALSEEIDRISQATNFNGINLLDGSLGGGTTGGGLTGAKVVNFKSTAQSQAYQNMTAGATGGAVDAPLTNYAKETVNVDGTNIVVDWSKLSADDRALLEVDFATSQAGAKKAAAVMEKAINDAINENNSIKGTSVKNITVKAGATGFEFKSGLDGVASAGIKLMGSDVAGGAADSVLASVTSPAVGGATDGSNTNAVDMSNTANPTMVNAVAEMVGKFTMTIGGEEFDIELGTAATTEVDMITNLQTAIDNTLQAYDAAKGLTGADAMYDVTTGASKVQATLNDKGQISFSNTTDKKIGFADKDGGTAAKAMGISNESKTQSGGLSLQIGDTNDEFNKVKVSVGDMSTAGLGLTGLKVTAQGLSGESIGKIRAAVDTVSTARSGLGALQNRLEHTINNLGVTTENMTAAESRIRDVDMAHEMMGFTKNNVLSQAAQAMLAQANQQPQSVLQLLR